MPHCVFCQISQHSLPAHVIYEDNETMVFLDIKPINKGHLLVIPKDHIPTFYELDDSLYQKLMSVVKKVAVALNKTYSPKKIGLLVKGFDVDHAHIHVVPLYDNHDIQATTTESDANALQDAQAKITQSL